MTTLLRNRIAKLEARRGVYSSRYVVRSLAAESASDAIRRVGASGVSVGRVAVLPEPVRDFDQWRSMYGGR